MLFNSFEYLLFLPVVLFLYWSINPGKYRIQNMLLIIASYVFYAFWDYRFLFLLIFSTSLDYFTGLKISQAKSKNNKKIWLLISIFINVGFLAFFKYYNFFIESFADFLHLFGFQPHIWTLRIILPVGISFYTFHGLSYVLDIYHEKIEPTKNIVDYSLFVCFFPLLVAGPIERATHLLPQLKVPRTFDASMSVDGLKQILWGFFKKVVIADNCAIYVNQIFENYETMPANALILGAILFSFQIYGDFSGYSDIALGSARIFGIELLRNFAYPYFARDIAEYWRRWHISLTTWLTDYIFMPLSVKWRDFGNRGLIPAIIVTFLVSGVWHGANYTFILWGFIHGCLYIPLILKGSAFRKRKPVTTAIPSFRDFLGMVGTFGLCTFCNIIFRSDSISAAWKYVSGIFSSSLFSANIGQYDEGGLSGIFLCGLFITGMLCAEWLGREKPYAIADLGIKKRWQRYLLYYVIIFCVIMYAGQQQQFVYFQF
jgi:D-alanyl-lipoteichoic acid acyltransferase DltB (MBOAT superfamily)